MSRPLISVIIPCYNGARYIDKLLVSIIDQDYRPIQVITIDDGSTDNTLDILKKLSSKLKKHDIEHIILSKENGGLVSAINEGLKVATGKYINFIGQDDYFKAGSFKKRAELLEKDESLDVVWAASNIVSGATGEVIDVWREEIVPARKNLFDDMINHNLYVWPPAAKLVRASTLFELNPSKHLSEFDPGENIQIFLPIYYKGNNVGYIDEALAVVTDHNDSYSRKFRNEESTKNYQNEIRDIFLDTLAKIDMSDEELKKYKLIIKERYARYNKERTYKIVNDGKDETTKLFNYDEQKFRDSYTSDIHDTDQTQLSSKLVSSAHSLEKSLSNDNFEIGYRFHVARRLTEMLRVFESKGYDHTHPAYNNTLSVLKAFYDRHHDPSLKDEIEVIFGDLTGKIKNHNLDTGGADVIHKKDKEKNDKKNFKDLAAGRFSVRTYSDERVEPKDIEEVVEIAMKTPTAYNRQPIKVRALYDKMTISKVLDIQGDMGHYDTPPVLLLVTADDRAYVGANERNQGFIDGGLFAMSILYALEYKKMAACALNTMFNEAQEKNIRGMLDIGDNEKFVTFVAVGHFNNENQVCRSFRYPASHIMSEIKSLSNYSIETIEAGNTLTDREGLISDLRKTIRLRTRLNDMRIRLRLRTRAKKAIFKLKKTLRFRTRFFKYKQGLKDKRAYRNADGVIITLTGYYNYGNIIQRYALQRFLQKNGYNFLSYAREPLVLNNHEAEKYYNTAEFVDKRIRRISFSVDHTFRTYLVGSDQVWRNWGYANVESELGYYFFDYLKDDTSKRIAYAASFGQSNLKDAMISTDTIKYLDPYIKKLDAISVRENSAVNIIRDTWGLDSRQVLDPTLLLTAEDYSHLINKTTRELSRVNSIFTYILSSSKDKNELIRSISLQTEFEVSSFDLEKSKVLPPVEQWLRGFRDAELVITDSFHGAVFSILNNTPFIVIENKNGGVARIESLMDQFNIKGRLFPETAADDIIADSLPAIDWRDVNERLESLRESSADWLLSAIKSPK